MKEIEPDLYLIKAKNEAGRVLVGYDQHPAVLITDESVDLPWGPAAWEKLLLAENWRVTRRDGSETWFVPRRIYVCTKNGFEDLFGPHVGLIQWFDEVHTKPGRRMNIEGKEILVTPN